MAKKNNNWVAGEKSANVGVGKVAEMCLLKGMSVDQTLDRIKAVFPEAKTTKKCIYYYRHQLGLGKQAKQAVNNDALTALMKELKKVG